jgi:hypothetical protein
MLAASAGGLLTASALGMFIGLFFPFLRLQELLCIGVQIMITGAVEVAPSV